MSVKGNLKDQTVAELIQHNCQDYKTAKLVIQNNADEAVIYLGEGQVVHAEMNGSEGEEVVFRTLDWNEGTFILDIGVKSPLTTIKRSWSSLLLEGAQRLDEGGTKSDNHMEVNDMSKLDDVLKEMSGEITGYVSSALVGVDGINIASHTSSKNANPETTSAQITMLLKLVDTTFEKIGGITLEDNLLTTDNMYILMRYLPGKQYYLGMVVNRKTGNPGNMRLISKLYADRFAKAMPS